MLKSTSLKNTLNWAFILFISYSSMQIFAQSTFHGDARRTGYYNSPDIISQPVEKWRFITQGRMFGSPVIDNEMLFIGSGDSCLYALNKESGQQIWKFKTKGEIHSTPAVSNSAIYFLSYDGIFYALNEQTGDLIWTFETQGEKHYSRKGIYGWQPSTMEMDDLFDFYLSSAVVGDSLVYFGCGDHNIYALDKTTGIEKWHYTTGGVVHSSPALKDGKLLCGSWDRYMYCLDAKTGTELWKFATGADASGFMQGIIASPCIQDSVAYFGCRDANAYAVNINTGTKIWSVSNSGSWFQATATIADSIVYFGTSDNTCVRAFNANTGKQIFLRDAKSYVYSSPAATANVLYYGSFTGWLYAIDRNTGAPLWSYQTDASKQNSAECLTNGRMNWQKTAGSGNLYQYSTNVYCMDKFLTLGSIVSSPVLDNGVLYISSADSNLYAFVDSIQSGIGSKENRYNGIESFQLMQNYPNPFNPETVISYQLSMNSDVELTVYDVLGRKVKTLVNQTQNSGEHSIVWDARDEKNYPVSSGIYFYQMTTENQILKKKMLLVR